MKQEKCATCGITGFVKQAYIQGHGFVCLPCWDSDVDNPKNN